MDGFLNRLLRATVDIVQVTSICSAVATSMVVVAGILLLCTRRQISNKISFRLALLVAFYEFIFHVTNIINNRVLFHAMTPTIACRLTYSIANFSKLMSVFTTTTIAYNLDMILIRQRSEVKRAQLWYIPLTLSTALLITLICTIYSVANEVCWLANFAANPTAVWIQWLSCFLWMFLGLCYSLYVVIRVIHLLRHHQTEMHTTMEKINLSTNPKLRQISFRITMYAVVPILTFFPAILSFTIQSIGYSLPRPVYKEHLATFDALMWAIAELLTSSTGLLTTLVFAFDPVVMAALADISEYIKYRLPNLSNGRPSLFFKEDQPYAQQTSGSWQDYPATPSSETHIAMHMEDEVEAGFDALKLL
ncbi:hypothetical protein K493DRAFT_304841 [Basidiobolus meristosporus CBS 931.73]|uniref:G-protein coupled receptors family 1 profile domain-containing protein n=1 Tax=Basidiobolus meristosporus CBS 931.73 TaxID=1314790 RepID=A0A1Y1XXM2_9FUNG|nr:hypothetical protein K493DRAFT_304841 [Basidiobolus meristosporus CBS 931.73]|eukprot:ORX90497.1 hypothetical protein K493DRAFT_304841 [Basidiobolus meristosporus CBS 931.73]